MAYDREFIKITWIFNVEGTDEIANTSLNFSDPGFTTLDATAQLADMDMPTDGAALATRMTTLLGSANMRWADYSELVAVRAAAVGTTGLELAAPKLYTLSPTVDGAGANVLPQASIVLSLRSNVFGPGANYGRMYLPHTTWVLDTNTPKAQAADVSAFATQCDTFIEGCNTDMNASVANPVDAMIMTNVTGRPSRRVNQIAVGDVVDTQRRRRNQLVELYQFRLIA